MIRWQCNPTYDFFISLFVLYHSKDFGLRASWAAGVRQRLDAEQREYLDRVQQVVPVPLKWLASLPESGQVSEALSSLEAMTPEARFDALFLPPQFADADVLAILQSLRRGAALDADSQKTLRLRYRRSGRSLKPDELETLLDIWRHPAQNAEAYLRALKNYQQAFFAEEEQRIKPYLLQACQDARALADKMPLSDLLLRLSRGVRLAALEEADDLVLAPSFWSAPLIFSAEIAPGKRVFVFGARPDAVSLIPGAAVPEELVSNLKALADATRLRILKYLLETPATPTELARHLRLRPPTVIHHLRILRLAGLVQITIGLSKEKVYALRPDGLLDLQQTLMSYLSVED